METNPGRIIGQEFFELRSRIGAALGTLAQLAPEAGADPDHGVILDNLANNLKDPFVFVVVGEVNVGKSTFLNALFSADVTKTGVVPTTDKIYFFKYGAELRYVPITRTLEEVFVPIDFLRDFHIVDTPGTNSIENEHQEITERFVPMADLVIFVFSAMNPWGASAWQFLEKVYRHWMRHVVFVLQQSDLRTEEEISAILEYMKQLCRQRFQREFPIFPISAKKAYLARSSGLDRDRLMGESGFPALESHISRAIGGSGQRLGKLATSLRTAGEVLTTIQSRSSTRTQGRQDKARALREVESELALMEQRTNSKLLAAIEATETDFEREAGTILARLRARLGRNTALASVFGERRVVAGLERALLDQIRSSSSERWSQAAVIVEDDVNGAAGYVEERMREDLKVQLREELRPDLAFWEAQRHRFVTRVAEMLESAVHRIKLEDAVKPVLGRTRHLGLALYLVLAVTLGGAGALALQHHGSEAGIVFGAGLLVCLGLWIWLGRVLTQAKENAALRLEEVRPELHEHLQTQLRDEVHNLYDGFTRILQPTREKLQEQEQRHTALQSQLDGVGQSFQTLREELDAMVSNAVR